jgi:hypothetical protein
MFNKNGGIEKMKAHITKLLIFFFFSILLTSVLTTQINVAKSLRNQQPIEQTDTTGSPILEVGTITASTLISAVLFNNGTDVATNVTWGIYVSGGMMNFIHKSYGGLITSINASGQETVTSKGVCIGFGKITIKVFASCDQVITPIEKKVTGSIFLIWMKI